MNNDLKSIRIIKDFPKKGIAFYDISTILSNPKVFNKVLSIDLPGHGGSTPNGSKTIEEYADFISGCIEKANLSNIHLCGHSMGGLVAMELASSKRKSLKSVVLFNCQYPLFA